jgi:hypothetical protein
MLYSPSIPAGKEMVYSIWLGLKHVLCHLQESQTGTHFCAARYNNHYSKLFCFIITIATLILNNLPEIYTEFDKRAV